MAWLRRLGAETAVKDGERRWRCARLGLCTLGDDRRGVQHGRLDDGAGEDRDECWNLRRSVIGVLSIGLAMAHAKRLLAIVLRGILFGHIGAGRHGVHRRRLIRWFVHAHRAGVRGRCQLN